MDLLCVIFAIAFAKSLLTPGLLLSIFVNVVSTPKILITRYPTVLEKGVIQPGKIFKIINKLKNIIIQGNSVANNISVQRTAWLLHSALDTVLFIKYDPITSIHTYIIVNILPSLVFSMSSIYLALCILNKVKIKNPNVIKKKKINELPGTGVSILAIFLYYNII